MGEASDIVLGLGNSLDYSIPWEPAAISALAAELGISEWPAVPARITGERELVCAILAYSAAGVGTERSVASVAPIEAVAARLGFGESLGGTAVRAGRILELLDLPCTIHLSTLSPPVQALLSPAARFLSGRASGPAYPHLIVQFTDDQPVVIGGRPRTPLRPNRLIFVHDPDNTELVLAPELPSAVAASTIFLVSGLNACLERPALDAQVQQLQKLIATMRPGSWAIYEDSGFHEPTFSAVALAAMAAACDVVGMNEDEFCGHVGAAVDLTDPAAVAAAGATLARRWQIRNLVVHTAHWAAAFGLQADRLRPALTGGVRAGAARYLKGDLMTAADLDPGRGWQPHPVGQRVATGLAEFGVTAVPGLAVPAAAPVTVGLGDSFVGGFVAGLQR